MEGSTGAIRRKAKRQKTTAGAVQYHCDNCSVDLTGDARIKCAVCTDFDLCVNCFSVGVELTPHKKTHAYRVMSNMNFPLFSLEWGADEELLLIEAIEIYGLGNWGDVASHVGSKTKDECEAHFQEVYMESDTAPLPDMKKVLPVGAKATVHPAIVPVEEKKEEKKVPPKRKKADKPTEAARTRSKSKDTDAVPTMAQQAGYHAHRQEFETEWNNDLELQLKDLVFLDDDSEQEFELKMKMLELYNRKLEEREFRRSFVIERNLIDEKKTSMRGKLGKGGRVRDLYDRLRVMARLMPQEEWKSFVKNMIEEAQLRGRIRKLQNYRRLGIHTRAGAQKYEREKKKRDLESMSGRRGPPSMLEMLEKDPKSRAESGGPALLSRMPGIELLSAAEAELCSVLVLPPASYAQCKETLIAASFREKVNKKRARDLLKGVVDGGKASIMHGFCEANNWLGRK